MTNSPVEEITILEGQTQVIYADRIINVGLGAAVSRLQFGMEVSQNTVAPSFSIVVPTSALLDALNFIDTNVLSNPELKAGILKSMDAIRNQIENL